MFKSNDPTLNKIMAFQNQQMNPTLLRTDTSDPTLNKIAAFQNSQTHPTGYKPPFSIQSPYPQQGHFPIKSTF